MLLSNRTISDRLRHVINTGLKVLKGHPAIAVLVGLECFTAVTIILPYCQSNNLHGGDTIGHLEAVRFLRDHLFPRFSGWNPHFYAGFPQGIFYHPLFHYATALLSFLIGLEAAFKTVISLSILLVLPATWYLGKKVHLQQVAQSLWLVWVWVLLRFTPETWGGNVASTLVLGQVTNTIAMVPFFLYVASLPSLFTRHTFFASSLWLAGATLSHVFAGIASLLVLGGFGIIYVRSHRGILTLLLHLLTTFLLTAFWTLPFLANREYLRGATVTWEGLSVPFLVMLGLCAYMLFAKELGYSYPNESMHSLIVALFLLATFLYLRYLPDLPFHFYRFQIYAAYLAFFAVYVFVVCWRGMTIKISDVAILVILLGFGSTITTSRHKQQLGQPRESSVLEVHGPPDVHVQIPKVDGRVLCLGTTAGNLRFQHRALTFLVAREGNTVTDGLFMESAPNSPFLGSMFRMFDPFSPRFTPKNIPPNANKAEFYLRLFDVRYILSPHDHSGVPFLRPSTHEVDQRNLLPSGASELVFRLYELAAPSELIEVLNYQPVGVKDSWEKYVEEWWIRDENPPRLLVQTSTPLPDAHGSGGEAVQILEERLDDGYLKFHVAAEANVPILVKISYFPSWKAYQDGKPIPIYKASPYLMLVYGRNTIEFIYQPPRYTSYLFILSLGTLLFCATAVVAKQSPRIIANSRGNARKRNLTLLP